MKGHTQKPSKPVFSAAHIRNAGIFSMAIAAIGGGILTNVYADTTTTDEVNITLEDSCSVIANIEEGDDHTSILVNNHYESEIGETHFTVYCNDNEGFSIYAIGYSNNTLGNTNMMKVDPLSNPETLTTTNQIPTGTASSGDTSNWAMRLTAGKSGIDPTYDPIIVGSNDDDRDQEEKGDTDYSNYAAVPSEYTKVAYLNSATDMPYPPEGEPTIPAIGSNFTSTYAVFISPTQPAGTYKGKVKYTIVHPSSAAAPEELPTALYLQNTTAVAEAIDNSPTGTVTAVDSRDNTEYTVGRLADGRIWLLDNLALDLTDPDVQANMDNTNTNASATSLNALFTGVTYEGDDYENQNLAHAAVSTAWEEGGDSYVNPLINTADRDKTIAETTPDYEEMDADWPIGVYYNYCAASAGSFCYDESYGFYNVVEDITKRVSICSGTSVLLSPR